MNQILKEYGKDDDIGTGAGFRNTLKIILPDINLLCWIPEKRIGFGRMCADWFGRDKFIHGRAELRTNKATGKIQICCIQSGSGIKCINRILFTFAQVGGHLSVKRAKLIEEIKDAKAIKYWAEELWSR